MPVLLWEARYFLANGEQRNHEPVGGRSPRAALFLATMLPLPAPSDSIKPTFRDLNFPVLLHHDLNGPVSVKKKLGLVIQHLAAHGNTAKMKGCAGVNRGWRRSELEGKHHYLWWAPRGTRQTKVLELPDRAIIVRAVRHHNDHSPLPLGKLDDYEPISQSDFQAGGFLEPALTESQKQFRDARDPVQLLHGCPGSGKTTALWNAIVARGGKRILYLTWSRELVSTVDEFFRAFAPRDVEITPQYFTQFIGEIRGADVTRLSLAESYRLFEKAIGRLPNGVLGPWAGRPRALYAEIRAYILGRAIPDAENCVDSDSIARLNDSAYLALRAGTGGVGKEAAEFVLRVMASTNRKKLLADIFPELAAAAQAFALLQGGTPNAFPRFDGVVLDEGQDMTLLESAVVVELCRVIGQQYGCAPWLLVAGDEGQTVRPSGFEWGRLKDMLANRLQVPREFQLAQNLRCPGLIADVVERATEQYSRLDKGRRPTKQRRPDRSEDAEAHLFHVCARTSAEAVKLMRLLQAKESVGIISPDHEIPAWPEDHVRVLTSDEAKGMEYQAVCILNPGRLLSKIAQTAHSCLKIGSEMHVLRTDIDRLRVVLSRATETLVFLDVDATDYEKELSQQLLGTSKVSTADELCVRLSNAEMLMDGPIPSFVIEAEYLLDDNPLKAWRAACQGLEMLPEHGLADSSIEFNQIAVRRVLLVVASRLLVDGLPSGLKKSELIETANETLLALGSSHESAAFRHLVAWTADRASPPFELLNAVSSLPIDVEWLRKALNNASQALRKAVDKASAVETTARAFTGPVESWIKATGYLGNPTDEASRLRRQAYRILLQSGDAEGAELIRRQLEPDVLELKKVEESVIARPCPSLTVKELATAINLQAFVLIKSLMDIGVFANQNEKLIPELLVKLSQLHGFDINSLPASSLVNPPSSTAPVTSSPSDLRLNYRLQ